MKPINLYCYIACFFLSTICLFPCIAKSTQDANVNIEKSLTTINKTWHPYPRSIQVRSALMPYRSCDKLFIILPIIIDLDILYVHSLFARQIESYPRIGLSFWIPYAQDQRVRVPNIWAILSYMELYQSHPEGSTSGNKIGLGIFKRGKPARSSFKKDNSIVYREPEYSFLATKEFIYHWLFTPSWQLNFGIGVLFNSWPKNIAYQSVHEHDNDNVAICPIVSMGIRYITHKEPFLRPGYKPIHYRKRKKSRIDCSIARSSRYLKSTARNHFIFRGSSLLAFTIGNHNGLICAVELGYSQYKKAYMENEVPLAGIEFVILLGHEIRYGDYLLQLEMGYACTDVEKPKVRHSYKRTKLDIFKEQSLFSVNLQYMLTDCFFIGITMRSKEAIPGVRLGVSF